MKLGWNLRKGLHRNVTSWLDGNNPASGEFTFGLESLQTPQLVLVKGTEKQYRWGPWDGVRFSGNRDLKPNPIFTPVFISNTEEVYYSFRVEDNTTLSRFTVSQEGLIQYFVWSETTKAWTIFVTLQVDGCDTYGVCGPYGSCSTYPTCKCLNGFRPKSPDEWGRRVWSGGCERKWDLNCGNGDGFVMFKSLKLPDHSFLALNRTLSHDECQAMCLKNCSCTAFTRLVANENGGNCVMWSGDLIDMRSFPDQGEALYVRMARAELKSIADAKKRKQLKVAVVIVISTVTGLILIGLIGWFLIRKRMAKRTVTTGNMQNRTEEYELETQEEDLELPLFDLNIVSVATGEFSFANKIGEGGFGPVYKGVLPSGQEIAVKRLSKSSGQGTEEFKNEVILIAKLQHRNLVKLLGCCIQGEEKMLIYEYLPNKGLNSLLFDETRKKSLTWKKRFDIITGISRGLVYLHQDSRLRIIHRDLKASNILLDSEMEPKISDFGIARIFGTEQTQERTLRIIGTYGYMSPEYAMTGHFSVKSDVFSFGVLLLEIVSGKKNWGFYHPDHDLNLLGHTWKLWNEGKALELIDKAMEGSFSADEVKRCIKVGLLCVQQRVEDRPIMSSVLLMLGNENSTVPEPKEPGFSTEVSFLGSDHTSSSGKNPHTANSLTVTLLDGR
ncbi:receptor-like serine/threonine-protein kinase SD1-8 isoform X2 [Humulus lupulus]|nr:receptor-like serine/threonine-protein kinase SD1-8 isoform X2 [Humulus lupulus]